MSLLAAPDKEKILSFLESRLEAKVYDTWCRSLQIEKTGENSFLVPTANPFYRDWLEKLLKKDLEDAFRQTFGSVPEIVFQVTGAAAAVIVPPPLPVPQAAETAPPPTDLVLNPTYTFENFIEGSSNRMAYAASVAVSEKPASVYNPLFIHGGVGLGKTHLLQAVCHAVLARNPAAKVLFLPCEDFVNGYISAVQNLNRNAGKLDAFRTRCRNADVLVVDDIHFLKGKEGSQEEFFHTFNALHVAGRQLILSSDQPPAEIQTLKEHLRSRFTSGLDVTIDAPDYEMRRAILQRKAETRGWSIPEESLEHMAATIDTNIRELEGKLTQVMAFASVSRRAPDLELVKEVFRHAGGTRTSSATIPEIQLLVARYFKKKITELQAARRTKSTSQARQICIYLCRKHTSASLQELGTYFGNKDHTTMLYSIRRVEELLARDPSVRTAVDRLSRDIAQK